MPDASVLLNTKAMQMFDVSRPWCLLEWLWGLDTFTADVDEDILEILNIIIITAIYDRWWVEYKLVFKLFCRMGYFELVVLRD